MASTMAVRGFAGEKAAAFEHHAGQEGAGGVGRQQHAVGHPGVAVAEVLAKPGICAL
jgi:hypothetical protein